MSQDIIKKYNIFAKKWLWQNFLINEEILDQIWNIVNVQWKNIVEVWPWYWALTEKLCVKNPLNLDLVELDKDMVKILEDRIKNKDFWDFKNIEINHIDVLKFIPKQKNYSVIANIPYYITSPILKYFLYKLENKPEKMVILMQKDVWDKIIKKHKNKSSVISLFIEKKSKVSEKIFVWPENFSPAPKVDSSVLLFESHNEFDNVSDNEFLNLIHAWFSENRKKVIKNLEKWWYNKNLILEIFNDLEIKETARAEELWIEIWIKILNKIKTP